MASQTDILEKIRLFSENAQKHEKQRADDAPNTVDYHAYNRRLDRTLQGLKDQVRRQEAALNEVSLAQYLLTSCSSAILMETT